MEKLTGIFQGEILAMSSDILITFTSSNIEENKRNNTLRRLKIVFVGGKLIPELPLGPDQCIQRLQ